MHNGIAETLEEIWTKYNPYDTHGVTNDLTNYSFLELSYTSKPKCKKLCKDGNNTQLDFLDALDIPPA